MPEQAGQPSGLRRESQIACSTVAVVITNYNTWTLTQRCVEALEQLDQPAVKIVVVDDASDVACPERLQGRIELLINAENLGLVRTLNRGVRATNADYVVLFDADAAPLTAFAQRVQDAFESDPQIGVVGFDTVDESGATSGSWDAEPGLASLLLPQRLHSWWRRVAWKGQVEAISVYTCAMALRRVAFDQVGGFDEGFDWLDLDHDFCWRARQAGWRVARIPEVIVLHSGSGAPQTVPRRVERAVRGRWRLLRKMGKVPFVVPVRSFLILRTVLEISVARFLAVLMPRSRRRMAGIVEGRRRILRFLADEAR